MHECGHLLAARAIGVSATLGDCTLSTGVVFIPDAVSSTHTMLIAMAGSVALMLVGTALVTYSPAPAGRMIGVVMLCRAWVDMVPASGLDGWHVAGSVGYWGAFGLCIIEVLICGAVIYSVFGKI